MRGGFSQHNVASCLGLRKWVTWPREDGMGEDRIVTSLRAKANKRGGGVGCSERG